MALFGAGGSVGLLAETLPNGSGSGSASFQLINDGTYAISTSQTGNWVTPADTTTAGYFQVKVDITAGGPFDDTDAGTGTYLDLSTTRTWAISSAVGSVTFTVTIREKASGIVRKTYTGQTLTATP